MEMTIGSDQKVSDALARVQQAIEAENKLPAPNPFAYGLLWGVLTIPPFVAFYLGARMFFVALNVFPSASDPRDHALVLELARDSFTGFVTGILLMSLVSLFWAIQIEGTLLKKLCGGRGRQQVYHFKDDRPNAPPPLREAVHELRNCWPSGEPEPRLTLQFPFDDGWIRVPTQVCWTLELPKPANTQLLPPSTRERSYSLTRF